MDRSYWAAKRVFVTGHTGFMGGWLCLWLQELGAHVTGFALTPPSEPNFFGVTKLSGELTSVLGDVRDFSALSQAMAAAKPEFVFHLAAQSLVRKSYAEPVNTYATNVMGTVHLLEAVRAAGSVRAVVNVTSDKCYENREWAWGYRESDAMGGYDPYSSSKGCSELVTSAYRRSFFTSSLESPRAFVATARAGNVIGGGDWAEDRLIPDFVRALTAGIPLKVRNPGAIRPWQHVLEPVHGYLLLAQKLAARDAGFEDGWNFGPEDADARPVGWVVDNLVRNWGDGASWERDAGKQVHEANYLKLDCSRARQQLGWTPRWALATALEETTHWYRAWTRGEDMRSFSLSQIRKFETLAPAI